MSRDPKIKPATKPTQGRFNDVQFVNWSLSADEKLAVKNWVMNNDEYDDFLSKLIESGHKITISYDNFRACYTASIVPTKDAKVNQGHILTGKGSTPLKAAKQVLYIHYYIMQEDWASYSTAKSVEELDD